MAQEIKPTYATFEQAKWLKEKRFDEYCEAWQYLDENCMAMQYDSKTCVKMPEQWQVVEWLRINHGIWILVLPQDRSGINFRIDMSEYPSHALFFTIIKYEKDMSCKELINTSDDKGELFLHFDIPQEAYSAAFDYIKDNNLI